MRRGGLGWLRNEGETSLFSAVVIQYNLYNCVIIQNRVPGSNTILHSILIILQHNNVQKGGLWQPVSNVAE